jgi:hypothetical protein
LDSISWDAGGVNGETSSFGDDARIIVKTASGDIVSKDILGIEHDIERAK